MQAYFSTLICLPMLAGIIFAFILLPMVWSHAAR
jgi:hypothetical protein